MNILNSPPTNNYFTQLLKAGATLAICVVLLGTSLGLLIGLVIIFYFTEADKNEK